MYLATLLIAIGTCICSASTAGAEESDSHLVSQLASVQSEVIQSYMGKSMPNPPRYYADGQWLTTEGVECWNCYDAAGTAAAVLFDRGIGGHEYEQIAIETTNTAIAQRQQANGSFEGSAAQPSGETAAFYGVLLGVTYLELRNVLEPTVKSAWSTALVADANYLIKSGQTTWYINGNINLRQAEVMWLAWQITGESYFQKQYEAEWTFTIEPPQARWPGFGLHLTTDPSEPDGSNGAGYLAESGGGTPGFDPEYTMVQLDTATQMYVLSREARWLRLVNLLYNQLEPFIEVTPPPRSAWNLNAMGGSRKSLITPFSTPALYVLVAGGYRPDLAGDLSPQLTSTENEFHAAMSFSNAVLYRDLAEELATPLLDEQWPSGIDGSEAAKPESEGECAPCPVAGGSSAVESIELAKKPTLTAIMTPAYAAPRAMTAPSQAATQAAAHQSASKTVAVRRRGCGDRRNTDAVRHLRHGGRGHLTSALRCRKSSTSRSARKSSATRAR